MESKRGTIDVPISWLVMIIISMAMFTSGLIILSQFFPASHPFLTEDREMQQSEEKIGATEITIKTSEKVPLTPPRTELLREALSPSSLKNSDTNKDCIEDLSCEFYFIYVPIGEWKAQELFNVKVGERAAFFYDISEFKFKKVGTIIIPLEFVPQCHLEKIYPKIARDHIKIKSCADRYADSLGIEYEKVIGLASGFDGGKMFFGARAVYASLGFTIDGRQDDTPSLAAHEIGHGYYLCDEYEYATYLEQNRYLAQHCRNRFPDSCKTETKCKGNFPPYRNYNGSISISGVCLGNKTYSVMGASSGSECGYDNTGGYLAVGDFS